MILRTSREEDQQNRGKELGLPLQYQVKEFTNQLIEKQFVEVNLRRRHLNEFQQERKGEFTTD